MGERSGERNGSRRSLKRLARREVAALSLAGLVLLVATAVALAVTGDLTQPAGDRRLHQQHGGGACADGHGLLAPARWRSARTGRASTSPPRAPWRASTATRPPARSPSPPGPPAASARRARGPAPTAMGSAPERGGGEPGRKERLRRRLARQRRRGAPQPRHDHRRDHPARRDRRLRERDGGGALRRRPWARGPPRGGGEPGREERLRRRRRQQRRGALQPQHDHGGDHPARRDRRLHQRDRGGSLRRRSWLTPARWRSAPTGRASTSPRSDSDAVARFNRNTTTGAITQPAGTAGCVSETGAGPCADGHGLRPVGCVLARTERASMSPRSAATQWCASTATRPPGRSPSPPGPPAASARPGRVRAPTAMRSRVADTMIVSPDGKNVYVASYGSNAVVRLTATRPPARSPSPPGPPDA